MLCLPDTCSAGGPSCSVWPSVANSRLGWALALALCAAVAGAVVLLSGPWQGTRIIVLGKVCSCKILIAF